MRVRMFVCHEAPHFTLTCGSGPCYFAPKRPVVECRRPTAFFSTFRRLVIQCLLGPTCFPSFKAPLPLAQACSQAVASLSLHHFSFMPRPIRSVCTPQWPCARRLQPPAATQRLFRLPPARGVGAPLVAATICVDVEAPIAPIHGLPSIYVTSR